MHFFETDFECDLAAPLPKRQADVLNLIVSLTEQHGYPPTLAELAQAMGLRNRMTVHQHVQALKKKGFVHWEPGLNRSLRAISYEKKGAKDRQAKLRKLAHLGDENIKPNGLPLVGTIAAGQPIDAIQTEDRLDMESQFKKAGCFALKVKGDSMIEDGILNGDYVIVRPNPSPKNGDIVVALLSDGIATLKRFFKEKGGFKLKPSNQSLDPILLGADEELNIQGVVVGLFRQI